MCLCHRYQPEEMQPCLGLRNEVRNTPEGSMRLDLNSNKTIRKSVPFTSPLFFFFFARRVYLLHIQISVLPSLMTWIHSSAFELGIFVITAYHYSHSMCTGGQRRGSQPAPVRLYLGFLYPFPSLQNQFCSWSPVHSSL